MTETTITVYYNGKWKKEDGSHHWVSEKNDKPVIIVINIEIKLADLIEKLYVKLKVDKSKLDLKLSFMSTSWDAYDPIYIEDDDDVHGFLMDRDEKNRRSSLRVEFIEKLEVNHETQVEEGDANGNDLEGNHNNTLKTGNNLTLQQS